MNAQEPSTRDLDWLELAKEAVSTAADFRDQGGAYNNGRAAEWAGIATLRAQIAQADALAAIAESLVAIVDKLDSIAMEIGASSPNL